MVKRRSRKDSKRRRVSKKRSSKRKVSKKRSSRRKVSKKRSSKRRVSKKNKRSRQRGGSARLPTLATLKTKLLEYITIMKNEMDGLKGPCSRLKEDTRDILLKLKEGSKKLDTLDDLIKFRQIKLDFTKLLEELARVTDLTEPCKEKINKFEIAMEPITILIGKIIVENSRK